jgi:DNA-binding XRE family transcriptional regulator
VVTKDIGAELLRRDLTNRVTGLAVEVLATCLKMLAEKDREEVFELLREIPQAQTEEELESLRTALQEIFEQVPLRVLEIETVQPSHGLQKWMHFVGGRIRALRERAVLTQAELAAKSGLPQSHISRLENGQHSPSRVTLERLASALGVPVSDLDPSG